MLIPKIKIALLAIVLIINSSTAQENSSIIDFNFGADVVSRYVWRGVEFGGDPAVPQFQPYLSLSVGAQQYGSFEFGAWGSYGFSGDYSENDLYFKYSYNTPVVTISAILNDYYYPFLGIDFTNFDDNGEGAHTVEAGLSLTGNESFPFSFLITKNIRNDYPDTKSLYIELGYAFSINQVDLSVFGGAAQGKSGWHLVSTDKFEFINVGISASKSIKISSEYSLPLGISWIVNPHHEKTFLVFKIGLF